MYIEAVIIGIILGVIGNGKISNITDMRIRGLILVILSVAVQISPIFLVKIQALRPYLSIFPFIALVLMTLAVFLNISRKGMKIILIGSLLNILVMASNNFYMPIDFSSLEWAGLSPLLESIKSGSIIGYMNIEASNLIGTYLGKILPLPSFYPLSKVLSIGDIVITLGIILFFRGEMRKSYFRNDASTISFSYKTKFK